ncbi:MAG: glycoside hydrolase family 127 protein, partial [Candidatus Bathyarchaeia archaeon]
MEQPKGYIVDTSQSPFALLGPVPIKAVRLEDSFWAPRLEILRKVTLPSQHRICEETGRLFNFRRASGKEKGEFKGLFFNDSDVYKWIEAVAFTLAYEPDESLHKLAQEVIEDVVAAQDADGYLNTYFTFERKGERWKNLRDMHELYCAGHLFQAAIAYYRATKEQKLLEASCRFADHISEIFGPGKRPGTCGHPEIEMALVELYRTTGRKAYLDLAQFFLDQRGKGLLGGSAYFIDHKPFKELTEIVGHAVRSLYLNCGATDIYMETGDRELWETLLRLWNSLTFRKIYVTGGAGARREGEAFGIDYELPSAQAYAETCAAVANFMWNWRLLLASGNGSFSDAMELALFNGVLSGISLDGLSYFYVNPLSDRGSHRRQPWFPCACCPPNIARLLASLPGYFYSVSKEGIWVHLYAKSRANLTIADMPITILQRTEYPWNGVVELTLEPCFEETF